MKTLFSTATMMAGVVLLLLLWGACSNVERENLVASLQTEKFDLQRQMQGLQADKSNLEKQAQTLQSDKSNLEKQNQSLRTDKSNLERQNQSLQTDKSSLERQSQALQADKTNLERQRQTFQAEKAALEKQGQLLKEMAGPPPASLDNFFPPRAPAPVYLLEMIALAGPFESIGPDLQQSDPQGARSDFETFKAQYAKVAAMVPEWKDRFPMAPVDALGQALASGDPSKVGPAIGGVGEVCGSCHVVNQPKVYQKYHFPDFEMIKLTDPVAKDSVSWTPYMQRMGGAFSAIASDLQQGQPDNARKDFEAFRARFKGLTTGCQACHTTPRTYFVDQTVMDMVDNLGKVLAAPSPDIKAFAQLNGAIGGESCVKCHLVHVPAAASKTLWKMLPDLLK